MHRHCRFGTGARTHSQPSVYISFVTMGAGKETEVEALKLLIASKERELAHLKKQLVEAEEAEKRASEQVKETSWKWPLKAEEYDRYGRQLILPGFGTEGQSLSFQSNTLRMLTRSRPTPSPCLPCPPSRRRWSRLSGSSLPRRRRNRPYRNRRRRCCRSVQPPSSNSPLHIPCWRVQGREFSHFPQRSESVGAVYSLYYSPYASECGGDCQSV